MKKQTAKRLQAFMKAAVSADGTRPVLGCVYHDQGRIYSADGHRLHIIHSNEDSGLDTLYPFKNGLAEVGKGADANGRFPDGEAIAHSARQHVREAVITVHRETLLQAVKIALVFAKQDANRVLFVVERKALSVSGQSTAGDTETIIGIESDTEGTYRFSVNGRYIIDSLSKMNSETVSISAGNPSAEDKCHRPGNAPVLVMGDIDGFFAEAIIMPMTSMKDDAEHVQAERQLYQDDVPPKTIKQPVKRKGQRNGPARRVKKTEVMAVPVKNGVIRVNWVEQHSPDEGNSPNGMAFDDQGENDITNEGVNSPKLALDNTRKVTHNGCNVKNRCVADSDHTKKPPATHHKQQYATQHNGRSHRHPKRGTGGILKKFSR